MTETHSPDTLSPSAMEIELLDIGQRHGFSGPATRAMFESIVVGGGSMAQFDHPEFGGAGQWMGGGMTMVSDLFNHALKARVQNLCIDLAAWLSEHPQAGRSHGRAPRQQQQRQGSALDDGVSPPGGAFASPVGGTRWWPGDWGQPASSGGQNGLRYAWFPEVRRLAIEDHGRVTVHATGEHRIDGVSQQQSSGASLAFTSQHGPVKLSDLPVVGTPASAQEDTSFRKPAAPAHTPEPASRADAAPRADVLATLERLADLKSKGVLTDAEFAAKKAELLSRI